MGWCHGVQPSWQPVQQAVTSCCTLVPAAQDEEYQAAGATIVDHAASFKADIVLKIRPPTMQEADLLQERAK